MFRKLFSVRHLLVINRRFSDEKIPTVARVWMGKDANETIDVKSELKEDKPEWKATSGNGKSIYDCENESWFEANKRED